MKLLERKERAKESERLLRERARNQVSTDVIHTARVFIPKQDLKT